MDGENNGNQKMKKIFLIGGIVVLVLALIIGGTLFVLSQMEKARKAEEERNKKPVVVEEVKKVIYADQNNLYAINPTTKEQEEIDTDIKYSGGATGYGSDYPMVSPDFKKVAYVKDDEIWLYNNGEKKSIDQKKPVEKGGFYHWYISGWSSSSQDFTYSISFDCGMAETGCSAASEDKRATGIYWYSLASGKSTKLNIKRADMWLPSSDKIVFFASGGKNKTVLKTYDVKLETESTLTKTPFTGLEPQVSFSDDGKKMIYSAGNSTTNKTSVIISDLDNTNQKVILSGSWAEYQWPRFLAGSSSDFVYSRQEGWACPDGNGGCPKTVLYSMIGGNAKKLAGIIHHVIGNFDNEYVVSLNGYSYDDDKARTLALVNVSTAETKVLLESKELLDLRIGWQ